MQPERCRAIQFQLPIDLKEMEVRSHLNGPVAAVADLERRDRQLRIERDGFRTAHVATHRDFRRRRIDVGGNRGPQFLVRPCRPPASQVLRIGVCTVTRRLPSVNTASICTIGMRSATPSMTSALVRATLASLVTSSIASGTCPIERTCGDDCDGFRIVELEALRFPLLRDVGHHEIKQLVELSGSAACPLLDSDDASSASTR